MKIIVNAPNKNTPGYNKRMYTAALLDEKRKAGTFGAEDYKKMLEFLSENVTVEFSEGEQPCSTFDALFEYASESDMETLLGVVGGDATEVPPAN